MKNMVVLMSAAVMGMSIAGGAQAQTQPQPQQPQTQTAQAQQGGTFGFIPSGVYVRGSLGYAWSAEDEIDYSPLWGIGVGYQINENIRADLTIDWRDRFVVEGGQGFALGGTPVDSQLENRTIMLNGYYELDRLPIIQLPGALKPYIGAGIGISTVEVDDRNVFVNETTITRLTGDDDNQFAWQLMIGGAYFFNQNLAFDIGYRYANLGEAELSSPQGEISEDLNTHEVVATLRYLF